MRVACSPLWALLYFAVAARAVAACFLHPPPAGGEAKGIRDLLIRSFLCLRSIN